MNVEKVYGFLSEGGGIHKTEAEAIKATYRSRLDSFMLSKENMLSIDRSTISDFLYREIDSLACILRGYPAGVKG